MNLVGATGFRPEMYESASPASLRLRPLCASGLFAPPASLRSRPLCASGLFAPPASRVGLSRLRAFTGQSGSMIENWLTRTFSLTVPVVGAPMAGPGEGRLAAAVSAAGGLGMVGVHASRTAEWVHEQAAVAAASGRAYGIGLMAWALDRDDRQLDPVV